MRKYSWVSLLVVTFLLSVCTLLSSIAIEFTTNGRIVPFILTFIPLCGFFIAAGYAAAKGTS